MPKIIHNRVKCIGCGVCQEMQPEYWRMSKKDGKATLIGAEEKKGRYILPIPEAEADFTRAVGNDCPVKIILVQ